MSRNVRQLAAKALHKRADGSKEVSIWRLFPDDAEAAYCYIDGQAYWLYEASTDELKVCHPLIGANLITCSSDLDNYQRAKRALERI